jgi:hypothetical protein
MTTLLIDIALMFWLLLFGGLALLPVITGTTRSSERQPTPMDDRVISITPARPLTAPVPQRREPMPAPSSDDQHDRPAA